MKSTKPTHHHSNVQDKPWHTFNAQTVMSELQATPSGLTHEQVAERQQTYGKNIYEAQEHSSFLKRLAAQVHNLLIYVLLAAALITLLIGHFLDAAVISAVVILNVFIGLYQEGKAEKSLQAIKKMLSPKAQVQRAGQLQTVDATELVPGDLILVASGDNLAADVRFISAVNLQIDESALTGESVPVSKTTSPVDKEAALGDRFCMGYAGTLVSQGQGRAIVVRTAMRTEMGRIGRMLGGVESTQTPLVQTMAVFSRWLTFAILTFAALLFGYGYGLIGLSAVETFMAVVGLAVAAIPEGLPAILTITLAIGVQRMASRHAVIRRLPAVETLGAVTVICSDKTGTLTRNEMTVQAVITAGNALSVSGTGYAPAGEASDDKQALVHFNFTGNIQDHTAQPIELLALVCALCNDSSLSQDKEGLWQLSGDPTEGAMLTLAMKLGIDLPSIHEASPRVAAVPFESDHRYMATAHACSDANGSHIILVKGAPEKLITMAANQCGSDATDVALDTEYWHQAIETQAKLGRRVLGFAFKRMPGAVTQENIGQEVKDLTLLGIAGIIDPPRQEAIESVDLCRKAGIRVKMITGDHAVTATAIANELGIGDGKSALIGAEIEKMSEQQLKDVVQSIDVFARASPEHKIRLVKALQAHQEVVAMTGDGVNDAPALKQADIGIAMGLKGTEAAKQAAEIVLADDNFASIVSAVQEGRTVYDNLKKTIAFLLPINGGESMAIAAAILLGVSLPITPLQILWVNMVSAVGLAMVLAFEPPEPDIMNRMPRDRHEPLLSRFLMWRILFVSGLFLIGIFGVYHATLAQGGSIHEARTMAVNALVSMEVFYLFSVRYLKSKSFTWVGVKGTPRVLVAVGSVILLQIGFTYLPFMQHLFATTALTPLQLLSLVGVGACVLLILEMEKLLLQKTDRRASL
jgi:magnesium-transporting ATPase (P-type)